MRRANIPVLMIVLGILIAAGIIGAVTLLEQGGVLGTGVSSTTVTTSQTVTSVTSLTTTKTTVTPTSIPSGILAVQLTDPPTAPTGVAHLYISYSDIEAHLSAQANSSSAWFSLAPAGRIDLYAFAGNGITLGSARVSAGLFDQVRLSIYSASVEYQGKNYTAFVPNGGGIVSEISTGGVLLRQNSTAGLVLDLTPTVLPVQSSGVTSFEMIPAFRALPIPGAVWNSSLTKPGSVLSLSSMSWFNSAIASESTSGSLTLNAWFLSDSSFLVVLKNVGNITIPLSSIFIMAPVLGQNATLSATTYITTITTVTTVTSYRTIFSTNSSTPKVTPANSRMNPASGLRVFAPNSPASEAANQYQTVSVFQILNNMTLVQPGPNLLVLPQSDFGINLAPGQTAGLYYIGPITSLNSTVVPNVQQHIIGGQPYLVRVAGPFGAVYDFNVTSVQ